MMFLSTSNTVLKIFLGIFCTIHREKKTTLEHKWKDIFLYICIFSIETTNLQTYRFFLASLAFKAFFRAFSISSGFNRAVCLVRAIIYNLKENENSTNCFCQVLYDMIKLTLCLFLVHIDKYHIYIRS